MNPFAFLTYLDPDNPTLTGSGEFLKTFSQATIDSLKNSNTFIKAILNDSYPNGDSYNLFIYDAEPGKVLDHNSDDFLKGYQSVFVDMYQGYMAAYNNYTKLLDAETKANTTSYMYGVQGKNENWKTLNTKMDAQLPSDSSVGYKYAYQDFINWLTADPHGVTSPKDDINTNRPLQAGLYVLGQDDGLASTTWTGKGDNSQKLPTADKFWEGYKKLVFRDSGENDTPRDGTANYFSLTDANGDSVTYPDIILNLGRKISDAVLDSFKRVYAAGVKQAALDALQGKRMAVDITYGVGVDSVTATGSAKTTDANDIKYLTDAGYFKDPIYQNTDLQVAFANGYRYVKFWLAKNTATLSTNAQNSFDYKNVDGYLVPTGPASKPTGPSSKENPIDKAIISVLSGIDTTYNVLPTKGADKSTVSGKQAIADSNDNYSAGHYMNTVYDLAKQVAFNARAEWTTAVENQINGINSAAGENELKINTDSKWYQMSPYIYTTVFNTLNKTYHTSDVAESFIVKALNKADQDIVKSATNNNGVPQITHDPTKVELEPDFLAKIDLNASAYYDWQKYDSKSIGVSSDSTITNPSASIKLGIDKDASEKTNSTTLQNIVNYAYYHEQAVAAAAFEAGYNAANKNLKVTGGLSAQAPTGDNAKYRFQYHSDLIGSLYPSTSDFDGSDQKTLMDTSANSDGTTTELTLITDKDGNFVKLTADVKDKNGTILISKDSDNINDVLTLQYPAPHTEDNDGIAVVDGNNSQVYIHIARVDYSDGTFKYRTEIQRNTLMEVKPQDGKGGAFNNVYKSGYDYRRSFMSSIEVKTNLKKDNQDLETTKYYSFKDDKLVIPDRDEHTGAYVAVEVDPQKDSYFKVITIDNDGLGTIKVSTVDKTGTPLTVELNKQHASATIGDKDKAHLDVWINADGSISLADYGFKGMFTATQTQLLSSDPKANAFIDVTIPAGLIGKPIAGISGTDNPNPEDNVTGTQNIYADALMPSIQRVTILMPNEDKDGVVLVPDHNRVVSDNEIDKNKGMSLTFVNGQDQKTDNLTEGATDGRPDVSVTYGIGKQIDATATIPYVAINKLSDGKTKDTIDTGVVANYDATKNEVTIDVSNVNSYRNGFNPNTKDTEHNVGPQIFDWTKVTFPEGSQWSIDGNVLTYKPTDEEKAKIYTANGLHVSMEGILDNVDTEKFLSDKVYLDAVVSSTVRTEIDKTINTSTDLSSTDHKSYQFKNADLIKLVPEKDQAKVAALLSSMRGRTVTPTDLPASVTWPAGVTQVAVDADLNVTVTFNPDAVTSATPEILLPLSVGDDGKVVTDATDNKPISSINLKLTLQSNIIVKNVVKPDGTKELPGEKTLETPVNLGGTSSDATTTETIAKDDDTYDTYRIYDNSNTSSLGANTTDTADDVVLFAKFDATGKQINNIIYHNYMKTLGYVWKGFNENETDYPATTEYPKITDDNKNSSYEGISFTQKIPADKIKGLDLSKLETVTSTDSDGITRTNEVTKEADGSLTIKTTIKADEASKAAYVTSMFKDGFINHFVLTDGVNSINVIEQSDPLDVEKNTFVIKNATINVSDPTKYDQTYDNETMTFNFTYKSDEKLDAKIALGLGVDVGGQVINLNATGGNKEALNEFLASLQASFAGVAEHPDLGNADKYINLSNITFGKSDKDGNIPVSVSITTTADVTKENALQNILNYLQVTPNTKAEGIAPYFSGVMVKINFENTLKQSLSGFTNKALIDSTKTPNWTELTLNTDGKLGDAFTNATSAVVKGYKVASATYMGNTVKLKDLKDNGDGTYSLKDGKYDFGVDTDGEKAQAQTLVWNYVQSDITVSLSNETKVYDGNPSTDKIHSVTLPDFLAAPKDGWKLSDFKRQTGDGNDSQNVKAAPGYVVTLSDAGIARLQTANPDFVIDGTTLPAANITDGHLTITPAAATFKLSGTDTKVYDGKTTAINEVKGKYTITLTDDLTYTLVDGDLQFDKDPKDVGSYKVTLTTAGLAHVKAVDSNYTITQDTGEGTYTVTPAAATLKLSGTDTKVYDGKTTAINDVKGKYTITLTSGLTYTLVDGDLQFDKDPKDVGSYKVTLTAAGLAHVKAVDSNYTITQDTGEGTYTITPKPLDPAGPNEPGKPAKPANPSDNDPLSTSIVIKGATKVYDGDASTDPSIYTVVGPTSYKDFVVPALTANDFDLSGINSQNVGKYIVRLSATGIEKIQKANKNYSFKAEDIQNGLFVITPAPITITAPTVSKTYDGKSYGAISGTVTGKPAKGFDPKYSLTDISGDINVGEYPITVTPTENANGNYTVTVVSGKLTITPQPLTPAGPNEPGKPAKPGNPKDNDPLSTSIVIKGATKVYDGDSSTDPSTFTVVAPTSYKDFVIPALTADDFDVSGINSQNVGKYVVKLSAAGIDKIQKANGNYSFTAKDIQNGLFVITPASVKIKAPIVSKDYDGKPYGGVISGNVTGQPTKGDKVLYSLTDISKDIMAGYYVINVTNGDNPNYDVTVTDGSLTINPITAVFKLTGTDNKIYDGKSVNVNDVKNHYVVTLSNGDKYQLQNGDLVFNTDVKNVANYTVALTRVGRDHIKAVDKNYVFTEDGSEATYIVNKRNLTITAQDNSKVFGQKDPSLSAMVEPFNQNSNTGLVRGDKVNYDVIRKTGESVGKYAINVQSGTNNNYNIITHPAVFTITAPIIKNGTVTVHYIGGGKTIHANTELTGKDGDSYNVDKLKIDGYTFKRSDKNLDGKFDGNTDITLYYTVNYTAVPVDKNGHKIPNVPPVSGTGEPGEPINMPDIPGYNRITVPVIPGEPGVVEVIYVKIPNNPGKPGNPGRPGQPNNNNQNPKTPIVPKHEVPEVPTPTVNNQKVDHETPTPNKATARKLPQTGDDQQSETVALGLGIAMLISALTLVGLKKRKKEDETD